MAKFIPDKVRDGHADVNVVAQAERPDAPRSPKDFDFLTLILALTGLRLASPYSSPDDLVLAGPSGTFFNDQALRDRFYVRLSEAGLKRLRLHDLRHSYCTALAAAGMPLRQLQHLAGHASYSTTEKYSHYSPDATQGMSFIERAFGSDAAA